MKIVHVLASIDPIGGGPPQVAVRTAAAQAMLGHEVHLVAYGHADSAAEARTQKQLARIPGLDAVTMHLLPAPARSERLLALRASGLLQDLLPDSGWLHLHGVWERIVHKAAGIAERLGISYCVRPAGMLDPWSLRQKKWKKQLALAFGVRRVLNRAAFIHALNAEEARLIEPLGLQARSEVIPNGVFLEEIEPLPPAGTFTAAHPNLQGERFILFLARLHYKKGLDYLARAWSTVASQAPDVSLVVAGPDEGAQAGFEAEIARSGCADRVHIVGPLYGVEKYAALVDAACFCLPSRQEGFSVAVLEALACGTPVVMSEACHFPEAAEAGAAAIVNLDEDQLADALLNVLSNSETAQAMGRAGWNLIRRDYTWPAIENRVVAAYIAAGQHA